MSGKLVILAILTALIGCQSENMSLDIQGHRGFRGKFPENSMPAFRAAVNLGVNTLEMDVVVSKDHIVVVSHDPQMLKSICLSPKGAPLDNDSILLYSLNYDEIKKYDCGSLGNARFPGQEKMYAYKPTLKEVITEMDKYTDKLGIERIRYDIEIKSLPDGDGRLQPNPDTFTDLVQAVLVETDVIDRVTIQSFDLRILREMNRKFPKIPLSLLVDNEDGIESNVEKLGFTPPIYSCYYKLLTADSIAHCHRLNMRAIPWTVNEREDMKKLISWGVDGIISDYPDILIEVAEEMGVRQFNQ